MIKTFLLIHKMLPFNLKYFLFSLCEIALINTETCTINGKEIQEHGKYIKPYQNNDCFICFCRPGQDHNCKIFDCGNLFCNRNQDVEWACCKKLGCKSIY